MITIKDIISLWHMGLIKNVTFVSDDSANRSIRIDDINPPEFIQDGHKSISVLTLSKEQIDLIDDENNYYSYPVFDEMSRGSTP